jgi:hypothetical protein
LTLICWVWFGLMSFGFMPLCLLASHAPGPAAVRIALYVFIVGVLWWGSFGYGMYLAQAGMGNGDRRLLTRGIRGTATVLQVKATSTYIGGTPDLGIAGRRVHRYRLRVSLPGREPYETYCSVASHGLEEGQTVEVAAAKHNRKRVAIDLGLRPRGRGKGDLQDSVPAQSGGSWRESRVVTPPVRDRLEQLSELGRLHREGVLTDEEFAAEKARILRQS